MMEIKPGGPISPAKLRWIADYLDLADQAIVQLAELKETGHSPNDLLGTEVQEDLRRWADEIETLTLPERNI